SCTRHEARTEPTHHPRKSDTTSSGTGLNALSVGLLLCTDLDCAVKVHSKPVREAFDRPVDEIIRSRREGLHSRTITFIRSVSDTERTTRHSR
ncbi:FBP domain-containing protein, partial [Streptomyces sp. NPDC051658]|uniref:FBP domain-containing protein n=1 Tax=Streptomyces sp. NPDC051658 TaxID=3365667 RepID=UPI0037B166F9